MKKTLHLLLFLSIISCSSNKSKSKKTEKKSEDAIQKTSLNTKFSPAKNFDLSKWNLSIPIKKDNGNANNISTTNLMKGYQNPNYFYTSPDDGAMVFKNFIAGPKTSSGTTYTRCELREMIYGTSYDTKKGLSTNDLANNWVFSSSDESQLTNAGGVDGKLTATLAINKVTNTGDINQVGRVVIGQIHASHNEPCRLYYRKLPNNSKGSIYFAHEPNDGFGQEQWYNLIGSKDSSIPNPIDGIALNEKFLYDIIVTKNKLTVTISRFGKNDISKTIDMANSGFTNDWMYFKAGIYTQNKTGDTKDYDKVSFYKLNTTH